MCETARKYRDMGLLDGVFTAGTDFSSTVAYVAMQLGLPGIPFETAMNATDKGRMRKVLREGGVPCPRFIVVTPADGSDGSIPPFPFPAVVKPVDNMGSRGVRRVDTHEELIESIRYALTLSRTSQVIIEEYIDGPEFSLDALVFHGEIFICGFADRHIFFPPYFVEMGHTIPTSCPAAVQREIIETFKKGIRVLGIMNGAAKGDVKYSPTGPVIGEIAARLSGGYMSGWTFPYSSGVHVTAGGLKIAVGLHPGNLEPERHHVSAERAFISIPGTVQSVEGLEDARNVPHVREVFPRVRQGSGVVFPVNNVEKCGNVISEAANREDAVLAAEEACRKIFIRLQPFNEATRSYLFEAGKSFPPPAFRLERTESSSALSGMPDYIFQPQSSGPSAIRVLPIEGLELEKICDWHGVSPADAFRSVLERTGISVVPGSGTGPETVLGSLFWRAFLKGGIQGGVWLIDTIRSAQCRGEDLRDLLDGYALHTPAVPGSRSSAS